MRKQFVVYIGIIENKVFHILIFSIFSYTLNSIFLLLLLYISVCIMYVYMCKAYWVRNMRKWECHAKCMR